jgi:hypothetical protein
MPPPPPNERAGLEDDRSDEEDEEDGEIVWRGARACHAAAAAEAARDRLLLAPRAPGAADAEFSCPAAGCRPPPFLAAAAIAACMAGG